MNKHEQKIMFRSFVENMKKRLQEELPGEDAQFLMAPLSRERIRQFPEESYFPKKSAVLILLFPCNDSIYTVLIHRPEYPGVHGGQVAFPGGKYEEEDIELSRTALREASEEIGIDPETVEIMGCLTDLYINPSNYLVKPFVGFVHEQPVFIANEHEVQKIIEVDLFLLNDKKIRSEKSILHSNGVKIKTPYYEIEGLTVWGATAMMISELNIITERSIFF